MSLRVHHYHGAMSNGTESQSPQDQAENEGGYVAPKAEALGSGLVTVVPGNASIR